MGNKMNGVYQPTVDNTGTPPKKTYTFENLVDTIAKNSGWNPLVLNETMTVTFDGKKRYKITRIE